MRSGLQRIRYNSILHLIVWRRWTGRGSRTSGLDKPLFPPFSLSSSCIYSLYDWFQREALWSVHGRCDCIFRRCSSHCSRKVSFFSFFLKQLIRRFPQLMFILDFAVAFTASFLSRSIQYMVSDKSGFNMMYGNGNCFNFLTVALSSSAMILPVSFQIARWSS